MTYRLLAIDIDGTLVNSRNELTPATQMALMRASASGIHLVLATGRRYSHALPLVEPLGIAAPLVTASGALIKQAVDHRTLYQASFDPDLLLRTLAAIDAAGYDPVFYGDTFAQGFDYYYGCDKVRTPELAEYLEKNPGRGRLLSDFITAPPAGLFAGCAMGTHQQMLELERVLQQKLAGQLHTHVIHSPRYSGYITEVSPLGVTKWSGIQHLARAWGIEEAEICAVGDDVNDIPMIREAGLGVAMGNAQPTVKAVADRIAPPHDDDGLVEVVNWLLAS